MRFSILTMILLASTSVHAVTVDFESDISNESALGFSSKGFDFRGNMGNNYVRPIAITFDPGCGGCVPVGWAITTSSGDAFSLESVDLTFLTTSSSQATIYGFLSGGGTITRTISNTAWHTESGFGTEWSDLTSVGIYISNGVPWNLAIDNFSATVVPVPPAFWLFGSALAGLGWLKRSRSARP